MLQDLLIPFITIGLAELGDKTQLSVLLLSSQTKKHFQLLIGVVLAFLIVDGVAVLLGSWLTNMIPVKLVKIISGIIFIILGLIILIKRGEEGQSKTYSKNAFASGFVLIFLTEWGDKTQIASGLFAVKYNPWMVLIGSISALAILSIMTVYLGKFISEKVKPDVMTKIAGVLFIVMGVLAFFF